MWVTSVMCCLVVKLIYVNISANGGTVNRRLHRTWLGCLFILSKKIAQLRLLTLTRPIFYTCRYWLHSFVLSENIPTSSCLFFFFKFFLPWKGLFFSCIVDRDLHINVRSSFSPNAPFTMSNFLTIMMLTYPYPTLKFSFALSLNYLLFWCLTNFILIVN